MHYEVLVHSLVRLRDWKAGEKIRNYYILSYHHLHIIPAAFYHITSHNDL